MEATLGVEERYSLITRRLELQNGWSGRKLQSLLTDGKPIKYQWGREYVLHAAYLLLIVC